MRFGPRAKLLKTSVIGTQSNHTIPNRQVKKLQAKYQSVLDVGCGCGRHLIFPVSVGLDMDVDILHKAKEKGMCLYADGQNLPIRKDAFDLALLCYSLEYMKDPEKAKREAKMVSKDIFVLTMPSSKYTWDKVNKYKPPPSKYNSICWGPEGCGYEASSETFFDTHQNPLKCPQCGKSHTFKAVRK